MARKIKIKIPDLGIKLEAQLFETQTSLAIWEALPIKAKANRWGDEIYFTIPVKKGLEGEATENVSLGDIGYWPVGRALCLFFGPTPVSKNDQIRAASPVNLVGKISGKELVILKKVKDGERIEVEKVV